MIETPQYSTENWTDEDYLRELNALRNAYIQTIVLSAFEIDNNPFKKKLGLMPDNLEAFRIATQRFRKEYAKTSILFMVRLPFNRFGAYCTYDGIYDSLMNEPDAISWRMSIQYTSEYFKELPFIYEIDHKRALEFPKTFSVGKPANVHPDVIKKTLKSLFASAKYYPHRENEVFLLAQCLHIIEHDEIQKALTEDLMNLGSKQND